MEFPFQKIAKKSNAQSIVEFALILPLLLMIMFGIIEFGRYLLFFSAVATASREAARHGAAAGDIGGYIPHYEDCAGIRASAKQVGIGAVISDDNIHIMYDHGPGTAQFAGVCSDTPPDTRPDIRMGDRIAVQVISQFQPIVPIVSLNAIPVQATTYRTILKDVEIEGTPLPPFPTNTPTSTNTPIPTVTFTPTNTPTNTPTPTSTSTPTVTPSGMPTMTASPTPTSTPTPTRTPTPSPSPTPTIACNVYDVMYSVSGNKFTWQLHNGGIPLIVDQIYVQYQSEMGSGKLQEVWWGP
ncbi:MAG: TadE family protein, partial [Omnitrophica WOR_2 bacterium]